MNPWSGLKGLPSEIWVLFAATLINRAGTMALPFLVLYLTEGLGVAASRAGLVLAFYGIGSLVTAPLAGRLSDRVGPLRIMKLSLISSGALLMAFPIARDYYVLLAITTLWAVISEAFRPANMAVISDLVPPDRRKSAFALNRLAINLGMSIGPAAGGFLATLSFPTLFYVDGATSILAGLVLAFSRWRPVARTIESSTQTSATGAPEPALEHRSFLIFLGAMVLTAMVFFQTAAAMPLYMVRDLNYSEYAFGLLLSINTVLIILIEVPLNTAMSNWPHGRALALGAVLTGAGFGALAFVSDVWAIGGTVIVWTFGEMILLPSASAFVAEIAPATRRGTYMGFYQMTYGIAFALGPWLGASVMDRFGASTLWGAAFIACLVSAAALWRIGARAEGEQERGLRASASKG
jgi:MFS family permease